MKALQGDRPLYRHQEEAIRRVHGQRNAVVATGTGSGKTEAFLLPILLHLYREFQSGQLGPGVRALILYPMNALANDQRERLGQISQYLVKVQSCFHFTFGQYIGETPEDEHDAKRYAREHLARRLSGERVLRSEMRTAPPHILLTNYSMLEYLLLRPDDSPLFDNGQAQWWTFLVLDEAHQYRGSRGIEMAMLLRRLKRRLQEGGRKEPFRCIATSATLMGSEKDRAPVSQFATDLFGESFAEDDIILGDSEPIPAGGATALPTEMYQGLSRFLEGERVTLDLPFISPETAQWDEEARSRAVGGLLREDQRAVQLRQRITGQPAVVEKVAEEVFGDIPAGQRVSVMSELVGLLLRARDPDTSAPLLSARYHHFLRSLEGAFVSYWPEKKVFLERGKQEEGAVFEVALCRECGQHYLVGNLHHDQLQEAIRDPGHPEFGATFFCPLEVADRTNEAELEMQAARSEYFWLCAYCGRVSRNTNRMPCPGCGRESTILVERQEEAQEGEDRIPRCSACGYQAPDPVREVIHGTDGPHAVIATSLYQNLPEKRKKILAFADGRQEAAFFAWYLQHSYSSILNRNLMLKAAQRLSAYAPEGVSIGELATDLRNLLGEWNVVPPAMGDLERLRLAWLSVYREFLTDEPRISLEGVGLVRWAVKWPDWLQIPALFHRPPWSLTEVEARDLAFILLDSMRIARAVEISTNPSVSLNWGDLELQSSQMRLRIGDPQGRRDVRSWDGQRGRRAQILVKLLIRRGLSEQEANDKVVEALRTCWDVWEECEANRPASERLLVPVNDGRRISSEWWRLHAIDPENQPFQCDVCGKLQSVSVCGICARHRCPGTLHPTRLADLPTNHYRSLYEEHLPGTLHVEEHTAQLDKEKAREFQRQFRNGDIHVLSCSTTFELGVDLGDLDTIFLRNVPPEAFNYAQRVGRAGRRSGYPGLAITYCRRAPHDLYHYAHPQQMLSGQVHPPMLSLSNEKIITRHVAATALSAFFRNSPERFASVRGLCADILHPTGIVDFKIFLHQHRSELEASLYAIVPADITSQVGLEDDSWISNIAGVRSRLADAEAVASTDFQSVTDLENQAVAERDYSNARWAQARARTIAEEDVLSFLSRMAVIPKYGFPVDVVHLDTQQTRQNREASEVSLQRDLAIAIAEFAPTSKLVANKKMWTSYGLKRAVEREWERRWYARCAKHNRFERQNWSGRGSAPPFERCCRQMTIGQYIDPQFGFITRREPPEEPQRRPYRVFTTRPYFAGFATRQQDVLSLGIVTLTPVSPGYLVVLCEGRRGEGFYICNACGAGFRKLLRRQTHETPYGRECHGMLEQVSLGHEFVTDVLQLQFHVPLGEMIAPVWFAYSLAYALVEGAAEVLEVPSTDLNTTVAHGESTPIPPIVLYDNVPGGAGLVARLQEGQVLKNCLETAYHRVAHCTGCGEDSSCYSCLRNYRNQFSHQFLQRGPVVQYLQPLLA